MNKNDLDVQNSNNIASLVAHIENIKNNISLNGKIMAKHIEKEEEIFRDHNECQEKRFDRIEQILTSCPKEKDIIENTNTVNYMRGQIVVMKRVFYALVSTSAIGSLGTWVFKHFNK